MGAFKLARFAYDRLQRQRVPPLWQDQIDLDLLMVQVEPSFLTLWPLPSDVLASRRSLLEIHPCRWNGLERFTV